MDEAEINRFCFERGISYDEKTNFQQKINDLKLWLSISNLRNVPDTLLVYSRIITMVEEIYEVSDEEDEYELLRNAESEIYFTEKFRIFEKTFGIEELHDMVKRID